MAEEEKQNENSARDSAMAKEEPNFPIFSEPPILPILSEKRAELANLRSSLLQEGLVTADGLDSLESVELSNCSSETYTAHEAYAKYFQLADMLCAKIDEFPQEEPDKISIKGHLKLLKYMAAELVYAPKIVTQVDNMLQFIEEVNMEGFESALEKLRVEQKNLREKVDGYFENKQKLRTYEKIEEQLQLGWKPRSTKEKQLGFWPITVDPEAGPTLMECIENSTRGMQIAMDMWMDMLKSARLSAASLSRTECGPSGTGESSQPQSGPSETGESSQPQSGN